MLDVRRIVLIGNGFDLAHGLKTGYRDFVNWHICCAFQKFLSNGSYSDPLISFEKRIEMGSIPKTLNNLNDILIYSEQSRCLNFSSSLYKTIIKLCDRGWVDIERQYFQSLKTIFSIGTVNDVKRQQVIKLNAEFDYIIELLKEYIGIINIGIKDCKPLPIANSRMSFFKGFRKETDGPVTFLNFNYTDTLRELRYANDDEVINIHGKVSDSLNNPIIFGYGDETDPIYQQIEDTGENAYLEHIKSFAYFKTVNYSNLARTLDADPYIVYIVGHSCGLSDRVLLSEIFEHRKCTGIQVFFHKRHDGSDNYKEITQEISRHFKPQNKIKLRHLVAPQDPGNAFPQN